MIKIFKSESDVQKIAVNILKIYCENILIVSLYSHMVDIMMDVKISGG